MDLILLDYNCFQRGFDDPRQIRIQIEALACQEIFSRAGRDAVQFVWSFMHEDETLLCPFPARKDEAFRLAALCKVRTGPEGIFSIFWGIEVLNKAFGPAMAFRFLTLLHREPTDCVEVSRRLYEGQTIDDIFERARKQWQG